MTCDCISPACPALMHVELECRQSPSVKLRSRDFDAGVYDFCAACSSSAIESGIFEGIEK
jgi:hypothetical protein